MLVEIIGWVYGILIIAFMIYAVIWNISSLYHKIKCNNKSQCKRRDCCFRIYCDKHVDVLTKEEIQAMQDMIERIKNQKKTA